MGRWVGARSVWRIYKYVCICIVRGRSLHMYILSGYLSMGVKIPRPAMILTSLLLLKTVNTVGGFGRTDSERHPCKPECMVHRRSGGLPGERER